MAAGCQGLELSAPFLHLWGGGWRLSSITKLSFHAFTWGLFTCTITLSGPRTLHSKNMPTVSTGLPINCPERAWIMPPRKEEGESCRQVPSLRDSQVPVRKGWEVCRLYREGTAPPCVCCSLSASFHLLAGRRGFINSQPHSPSSGARTSAVDKEVQTVVQTTFNRSLCVSRGKALHRQWWPQWLAAVPLGEEPCQGHPSGQQCQHQRGATAATASSHVNPTAAATATLALTCRPKATAALRPP